MTQQETKSIPGAPIELGSIDRPYLFEANQGLTDCAFFVDGEFIIVNSGDSHFQRDILVVGRRNIDITELSVDGTAIYSPRFKKGYPRNRAGTLIKHRSPLYVDDKYKIVYGKPENTYLSVKIESTEPLQIAYLPYSTTFDHYQEFLERFWRNEVADYRNSVT